MNSNPSSADNPLTNPQSWVDQYGDFLFGYALSRVQDPGVAEDLVQEAFLGALKGRQNFQGRSSERTWLTGILKHKIVDYFRRQSKEEPAHDTKSFPDSPGALFDGKGKWKRPPTEWVPDPMELIEKKEFWRVLQGCLSELPGRLAHAFTLREIDGLDTREICKVLDISATNLWVRLHRARMTLRRCLEINWFDLKSSRG